MEIETEIDDLKRRVCDLEGAGHLFRCQSGDVPADLLTLKVEIAAGLQRLEAAVVRAIGRIDTINTQVWSLRDDLPELIDKALVKHKA